MRQSLDGQSEPPFGVWDNFYRKSYELTPLSVLIEFYCTTNGMIERNKWSGLHR